MASVTPKRPRGGINCLTRKEKQPLFDLFELKHNPDKAETDALAEKLRMSARKVRKWFADRRGDLKRRPHEPKMVSTRKNKVRLSIGIGGIKMISPSKKSPDKKKKKKNAADLLYCHRCLKRQEVALTCLNCDLSFCGRILKDEYRLVKDPVTGWPCPRCTGVCNCDDCNAQYAKVKTYPSTRIAESSGASSNSIASDAGKIRFEDLDVPGRVDVPGREVSVQEKIWVTVRVRPLTPKEASSKDFSAWFCIDDRSIVSRNQEPPIYIFDKVFSESCKDKEIYEEGARDIALSAMKGINATVMAYGQSSSGKTFTMSGITESVIRDIYAHISETVESTFVIRFSAIEIYNEDVFDLNLNRGVSRPLDVYDDPNDPEKGTLVKDLTEMVVKDAHHLREMIAACVGKRKVGETHLNKRSSRSHQIFKLKIESSPRDASGGVRSLFASLSLVDLAGSESAADTNACGVRLKEGGKINTSLLTLTKVIKRLSNANKSDRIPYRDSKLTRILKSSLGGNARTAIICTLSPASSHVDQSHMTLRFAASAKRVTNTAQVNMAVPVERLVDRLRNEVTRLKAELVNQKLKIEEMEIEKMSQLKRERSLLLELADMKKQSKKCKRHI